MTVEELARAIAVANLRTHDYTPTGKPRIDDGFEWYASPREMAVDIVAALSFDTRTPDHQYDPEACEGCRRLPVPEEPTDE